MFHFYIKNEWLLFDVENLIIQLTNTVDKYD